MNPLVTAALGPLAGELSDDLRDLCVVGDGSVWVHRGDGFHQSTVRLTPLESRRIGVGLMELGGGRVDDAKPYGDTAIAGKVRVHVVLPPVSRGGASVSLRFPRSVRVSETDYLVPPAWDWEELAQSSVIVTGATGSGKTTLLTLLAGMVPHSERIVAIEDIPELEIPHPHVTALVTRDANAEGAGEVSVARLVRESLRMRPDRIIVGEVRGPEVGDMLMALSTGHRGFTTVHAHSPDDVPERLTALGMVADISPSVMARLVPGALQHVVHCERDGEHVRLSRGVFRRRGDELFVE